MHRYPAKLVTDPLAFTGVYARSYFEVDLAQRPTDRTRATHRRSRSFETGEEPVTGRVELAAAEAFEKRAHARVVLVEDRVPAAVAELTCVLCRANDVREKDRRQQPVGRRSGPHAGQELLELREHRLHVSHPEGVVFACKLDETCTGNRARQITAGSDWKDLPITVQHERGGLNCRQHRGDVGPHARFDQCTCHGRARSRPLEDAPEATLQLALRAGSDQLTEPALAPVRDHFRESRSNPFVLLGRYAHLAE